MEDTQLMQRQLSEYYFGAHICSCIIPPNKGIGGIYLGRVHMLYKIQELKDKKIGAILSVIDKPIELDPKDGFTHLHINIEDGLDKDISQYFEKTYDFLEENLSKTNVYVHCQMGVSRSSTIVIAYLMRKNKQRYVHALNYVKELRSCVEPNYEFFKQLLKFEQDLFQDEFQ